MREEGGRRGNEGEERKRDYKVREEEGRRGKEGEEGGRRRKEKSGGGIIE